MWLVGLPTSQEIWHWGGGDLDPQWGEAWLDSTCSEGFGNLVEWLLNCHYSPNGASPMAESRLGHTPSPVTPFLLSQLDQDQAMPHPRLQLDPGWTMPSTLPQQLD